MIPLEMLPQELRDCLENEDEILLVDIRHEEEREQFLFDKAIWIPELELPSQLDRLFGLGRLVIVCQEGVRSQKIAKWLWSLGFDARSLVGGAERFIFEQNGLAQD